MTLSVLAADGRLVDIEQPARDNVADDDALLSFLALQLMHAPAGRYRVQSTDARGAVEAAPSILIAAAGEDVGPHGEQIAWDTGDGSEPVRRQCRQIRERLVLSARQAVERAEFEATGELPDEPRVPPHPDRVRLAAERAASAPHDAASDARATAQLSHDLLDGYRHLPPVAPGAPRRASGADERHLAEHFEQVACGDGHTLDERRIAALVALGQRASEATEVRRESDEENAAALDRIAVALETLVGFAEDIPTRRRGWWRRGR